MGRSCNTWGGGLKMGERATDIFFFRCNIHIHSLWWGGHDKTDILIGGALKQMNPIKKHVNSSFKSRDTLNSRSLYISYVVSKKAYIEHRF